MHLTGSKVSSDSRSRLARRLTTAPLVLAATIAGFGLLTGQAASSSRSLDAQRGFEVSFRAKAVASGTDSNLVAREYDQVAAVEGGRYRFESSSRGDSVPLVTGISWSFDGRESMLHLPESHVTTLRAGEIEAPLYLPIPDPILLAYRAILALDDPIRADRLAWRDLLREPDLRRDLESRAAALSGMAAIGLSSSDVPVTRRYHGNTEVEVRWRSSRQGWMPAAFRVADSGPGGSRFSWEVTEWSSARGVQASIDLPSRIHLEAYDDSQAPLSMLAIELEVTAFRELRDAGPREFRLDPDDARNLWDEESKIFLRHAAAQPDAP